MADPGYDSEFLTYTLSDGSCSMLPRKIGGRFEVLHAAETPDSSAAVILRFFCC